MRFQVKTILAILAAEFWAATALAADDQPSNPSIQSTISSQIEAFRADDFDEDFSFASPNIRSLFGTSDNFGLMVRRGYPMVWRPGELKFLELRDDQGLLWQKVLVQDQDGSFFALDYQMVETSDGWRISGVYLVRAPQVGA